MNRGIFAAAAALSVCTPAQAVIVQFQGVVDQQAGDNSEYVQVGDTVTITINFDPATQIRDQQFGTDDYWFQKYTPTDVFRIETSRGLSWSAVDETFDDGVYLTYGEGTPVLHAHTFVKAGTVGPEFNYFGDTFGITIVTPGSQSTALRALQSFATNGASTFSGSIAYVSAAPEPATWAMMILGFGAIGFSARQRFAGRAMPFPA